MKKPLIGIILDHETQETYAKYPWYALRENYFNSILKAGGVPIGLPYGMGMEKEYANLIDGLLIPGGDFDIDPAYYNEEAFHTTNHNKDHRTKFEFAITQEIFKQNKPILGVCAGEQLINVMLGGSLVQHISDEGSHISHQQIIPKHLPSHHISISPGTILYDILGTKNCDVNSTHHQAVKDLGKNIIASAIAEDGIIEAIEVTNHKFCIGVQWHPEYLSTEYDKKLFQAFIKVCNDSR